MRNIASRQLSVFILAGGLSTRMGRDKSRLRIGGQTMVARIKRTVAGFGRTARVIRTDAVARCGPLGGIFTALKRTRADDVLILACDMPQVTAGFLRELQRAMRKHDQAVFAGDADRAGFPLLLRRAACLPVVERQILDGKLSLQNLATALNARTVKPASRKALDLVNINTPDDLAAVGKPIEIKPA